MLEIKILGVPTKVSQERVAIDNPNPSEVVYFGSEIVKRSDLNYAIVDLENKIATHICSETFNEDSGEFYWNEINLIDSSQPMRVTSIEEILSCGKYHSFDMTPELLAKMISYLKENQPSIKGTISY